MLDLTEDDQSPPKAADTDAESEAEEEKEAEATTTAAPPPTSSNACTTTPLYCTCKNASDCIFCGIPMKDRDETRTMVQTLQENPRHADFGVFGNGPLLVSDIPESSSNTTSTTNTNNSSNPPEVHVGIDEAGRGSVLGPMVYGAAYWSVAAAEKPGNVPKGFQDSKALSEETRFRLFDELLACPDIGFVARSLLPAEISRNMQRSEPYNLNQMSHDSAMIMIRKLLEAGVPVKKCFVDTVGNPMSYRRKLEREFPTVQFVVESKADAKYPTCSAASVVAKVMRDRMLSNWTSNVPDVSKKVGSGYPSDPVCKAWMEDLQDPLFGYCDLIRFSWAPTKTKLEEKGDVVVFQADVDDDDDELQRGMSSFLKGGKKRKRLGYFEKRKMRVVDALKITCDV